mmetsp:Transcript_1523/g.9381  ORF Transcript_1523/g.9381 Transcript_1523/m.9381 type:complete len:113 (+) Transcript_1523:2500-2838(+)
MGPKPPAPFQDAAGPFRGSTDARVVAKARRNLTVSLMQSSKQLKCGIHARPWVQLASIHLRTVGFWSQHQDGAGTDGEKPMHLQGDGRVFYFRLSRKGGCDRNKQARVTGRD